MIPEGSRVAEIGTDHGILPRRLLASGRASFCVATDLTKDALAGLRRLMQGHPRRDRLALRAGDGLSALEPADRMDVVVLAGMGATRICRILGAPQLASLGVRRLVLQPQSDPALLRRWLWDHGWEIVQERMAFERGRFYVVMAAERAAEASWPGHAALTGEELLEAGPCLVRSTDPLIRRFWQDRLELYECVLEEARAEPTRARIRRSRDRARRILQALPQQSSPIK